MNVRPVRTYCAHGCSHLVWAMLVGLAILMLTSPLAAYSLDVARDSVKTPIFSDSALILPDSTLGSSSPRQAWLYPLGLIAVTGVAIYFLFSTRSR